MGGNCPGAARAGDGANWRCGSRRGEYPAAGGPAIADNSHRRTVSSAGDSHRGADIGTRYHSVPACCCASVSSDDQRIPGINAVRDGCARDRANLCAGGP